MHAISQLLGIIVKIIAGLEVWIYTFVYFFDWGYLLSVIFLCFNGLGFYYPGNLVKFLNELLINVTLKLLC